MSTYTEEITAILKKRREENTETKFAISDLLRAKVMFNSLDKLRKALSVFEQICVNKSFSIV